MIDKEERIKNHHEFFEKRCKIFYQSEFYDGIIVSTTETSALVEIKNNSFIKVEWSKLIIEN